MTSRRVEWWLLLGACLCAPAVQAGKPAAQETAAPSLELLEFLGAWETPEGKWVDPLSLLREGDDNTVPASPAPRPGQKGGAKAKVKRDD